jgi:predicted dehydrogenase
MSKKTLSRRTFLRATAGSVAAAGLTTVPMACSAGSDDELRIGVIGVGRRGQDHLAALGYLDKTSALGARKKDSWDPLPGSRVVAVADPFKANLEEGARQVRAQVGEVAAYADYRDLLDREDVDAVVIATPDHLHTPIAIDAAKKGADVYVEKCISNNVEETFELEAALKANGRILQAGFQTRQDHIHKQAGQVIANGHIGKVHMVETFFHRGGEAGAWVFPYEKNGGPPRDQIDWELFLGNAPAVDYSPKRYFGWRCFWDYSTGISGDILTHVLNSMKTLIGVGIPSSVTASGGIYYWKDGRETPDQFNVLCEYPDHEVSITFQSTLSNAFHETATRFLGEEGTIELDWRLRAYPDQWSKKYAQQLASGAMNPRQPFINIEDTAAGMVAHAAPSQLWLGGRGATLTTRSDGEVQDTTRLHHQNFLDCIRSRQEPDAGFQDALPVTIAAHMATISYREGRRVVWDAENRKVI